MNPRTRDLMGIWCPIALIVLAIVALIIAVFVGTWDAETREAALPQITATLTKIAVILVLGGLACGFVAYLSGPSGEASEGKSDE